MSQVKNTFDERLSNTNDILNSIALDTGVQNLVFQKANPDKYERYASLEVRNKLKDYINTYSYIDSIILYYGRTDLTITNSSVYRDLDEFLLLSDYAYWEEQAYAELLEDVRYQKYAGIIPGAAGRDIFTVVKRIQLNGNYNSTGYIIVNFYYDFIRESMKELDSVEQGMVHVTDSQGNEVLRFGNEEMLEVARQVDQSAAEQVGYVSLEGGRYLTCRMLSDTTHFRYAFILPASSFEQEGVDRMLVVVSGLCILLGVFLCIFIARRNATPIVRVSEIIRQHSLVPLEPHPHENEVEFINRATLQAANEYGEIKSELAKQIPILQSNVISNMLKGLFALDRQLLGDLHSIGIDFEYSQFTVFLLHFAAGDGGEAPYGGSANPVLTYNWHGVHLKNVISDLFSGDGKVYFCELDIGRLGVLLNADYRLEERAEEVEDLFNGLIREMREGRDMLLTVVAGGSASFLGEASSLYARASEAMDYQVFHRPGQYHFANGPRVFANTYSYPGEMETLLSANVKSGNEENVAAVLEKICEENLANHLSIEVMKALFIDLSSTLANLCSTLGLGGQLPEQGLAEELLRCEHYEGMKALLLEHYRRVTLEVFRKKEAVNRPLIESILQYVQENYTDRSLSLNMVANAFNLNASYLSSYFKKYTGENFYHYINQIRLAEATRLLDGSEEKIAGIAEKVGYTNSSIFINNFKKAYGITPGNYRSAKRRDA